MPSEAKYTACLDISDREIRLVQIRREGERTEATAASYVALPDAEPGSPEFEEALQKILRRVKHLESSSVIVTIPSEADLGESSSTELVEAVREALADGGVTVARVESRQTALVRWAAAELRAGDRALLLMVSSQSTDAVLLEGTEPVLFNRLPLGAEDLCSEGGVDRLAADVFRSFEMILHQRGPGSLPQRVLLSTEDLGVLRLGEALSQALRLPVELAGANLDVLRRAPWRPAEAPRYLAAVNTALRQSEGSTDLVPREAPQVIVRHVPLQQQPLRLGAPLAISGFLLSVGAVWTAGLYREAAIALHDAAAIKTLAETKRAQTAASLASGTPSSAFYDLLSRKGVAAGLAMDQIASRIPDGVGLTRVRVDARRNLSIAGESLGEKPIMTLLNRLRQSALFAELSLGSLERVTHPRDGYRFEIVGVAHRAENVQVRARGEAK